MLCSSVYFDTFTDSVNRICYIQDGDHSQFAYVVVIISVGISWTEHTTKMGIIASLLM